MSTPTWLGWAFTAVFVAIAGYSVARLVAAGRSPRGYHGCHRAVDVAHVVMAAGMAVMVSPVGGPLPMAAWQTIFLLLTAWFVGAWARGARTPPIGWHGSGSHHAISAAAMVYMLLAVPHDAHAMSAPWTQGPHTGQAALPLLGWVFIAYLGYFTARFGFSTTRALLSAPAGEPPEGEPVVAVLVDTRVPGLCQVAMAAATAYLILEML